jgi:non-ribosomal peptide synthetase component F
MHSNTSIVGRQSQYLGVTKLTLVPSLLKTLLQAKPDFTVPSMRVVHCSGESSTLQDLEGFERAFSNAKLFNIYGSSEVGADVTVAQVLPAPQADAH